MAAMAFWLVQMTAGCVGPDVALHRRAATRLIRSELATITVSAACIAAVATQPSLTRCPCRARGRATVLARVGRRDRREQGVLLLGRRHAGAYTAAVLRGRGRLR